MTNIKDIKTTFNSYKEVIENYFFMTFLQGVNALFGILIYPFVIRRLGLEQYGIYVFALALVGYFSTFIAFGFANPAIKKIAINNQNQDVKSNVYSTVFYSRAVLLIFSTVVFIVLLALIKSVRNHWIILIVCYVPLITDLLSPNWYFQAIQKMKVIVIINVIFRCLSIPFILFMVLSPNDLLLFTVIASATTISVNCVLFIWLLIKEKLRIRKVSMKEIVSNTKEALPFFYTTFFSSIKEQTIKLIIGRVAFSELAIFDLASKIISIFLMLVDNINIAIYPEILRSPNPNKVKKIMKLEYLLGLGIVGCIILLGKPMISILGGSNMLNAYPMSIILSFSIIAFLVSAVYQYFIFVPQNRHYLLMWNQVAILSTLSVLLITYYLVHGNILLLVTFITISELMGIIFCHYMTKRHQLLPLLRST